MLPKEHGAYGQLLFPLITALAIGRPRIAALAIVCAAVFLFLAHEPLLVLVGQRGARAAREQRPKAVAWFAACTTAAIACGGAAIAALEPSTRTALLVPAACGAVVVALIAVGREHTTLGEIASAIALSSVAYPVAIASGSTPLAARSCAIVFAIGFGVLTICVRAVIANTRRPPAIDLRGAGVLVALVGLNALVSLARHDLVDGMSAWAAAPLATGGGVLAIVPPSARQLRVVGWTLVATTAATSVILVAALR